jgi:acetolactate synthase-1/2/3 large subunit
VNGAELVVKVLDAEGVRQVYGLPGTTIMDVLDALARQTRIRYLSVRHEQVAAFMADGLARATGDVGVCIASRGPGAANMATAVANAHDESVPLLAIVGQVGDDIAERAAFEEMDLLSFFRPITKWCVQVHSAHRIPELLHRAIRVATSGRPGPVAVSLPLDVLKADLPVDPPTQPRFRLARPWPAPAEVTAAAELLAGARRPLLLVGGGVRQRPYDQAVVRLAELLGGPVATTWARKNRFPNAHPQFLGALGNGAFAVTESALRDADAVLALGCRFSEFTTKRWTLPRTGTALVHVDIDPHELGRVYVPEVGLHAGTAEAAAALCEALAAQSPQPHLWRERTEWLAGLRQSYLDERVFAADPPPAGRVSSAQLTAALREVLDRQEATVVLDAPSLGAWVQRHVDFDRAGSYYASAGGTMAWGFPAAMGIRLARPHQPVICVSGDGSFWMVAHDLETAVRENIPVVNVVANNFAYGNTRDRQRTAHGGRYLGVFYDNPDLAEFARLLGAHGERVTDAAQLVPAIERALASGLPAVVDVIQDRHEGLPAGLVPPVAK